MAMPHPAYRLHAMGPAILAEPECMMSEPPLKAKALLTAMAASLLLRPLKMKAGFFGFTGDDALASALRRRLMDNPIDLTYFRRWPTATPRDADDAGCDFLSQRCAILAQENQEGHVQFWPEEPFYQASLVLFQCERHAELWKYVPAWLAKSKRRGTFPILWGLPPKGQDIHLSQVELLVHPILSVAGQAHQDLMALMEEYRSQGLRNGVVFGPNEVAFVTTGGIFGRCEGHLFFGDSEKGAVESDACGTMEAADWLANLWTHSRIQPSF